MTRCSETVAGLQVNRALLFSLHVLAWKVWKHLLWRTPEKLLGDVQGPHTHTHLSPQWSYRKFFLRFLDSQNILMLITMSAKVCALLRFWIENNTYIFPKKHFCPILHKAKKKKSRGYDSHIGMGFLFIFLLLWDWQNIYADGFYSCGTIMMALREINVKPALLIYCTCCDDFYHRNTKPKHDETFKRGVFKLKIHSLELHLHPTPFPPLPHVY